MAVHEQCPEPLFHDFEIVIVPFLQVFVDSVWYKAKQSKGKDSSRFQLEGILTKRRSPVLAAARFRMLNISPQTWYLSYITRAGTL